MVCLDDEGRVVRPALLWNDVRSAGAAADLVAELGGGDIIAGAQAWADAVGVVPVASFTGPKLRWLADAEPHNADRTAAVCLPHDWLTWRLAGAPGLQSLTTDRGDASGTAYWSARTGEYRYDLLELALRGRRPHVPRVAGPAEVVGRLAGSDAVLGAGSGDNAAAALGVAAQEGDVVVSIGTSGVVSAVTTTEVADPTGIVAGFADATGRHLPLVCTLNAARVLDSAATLLGVDHSTLSEGPLCGLADGVDALVAHGVAVRRIVLVGGGARSEAVQRLAPAVLGRPVVVPPPGEYVADGAARQAAWALSGETAPPEWPQPGVRLVEADPTPQVRARYAEVRERTDGQ